MTARLQIFRSLWTNGFSLEAALEDVSSGVFDGIEGPVPGDLNLQREFASGLLDAGVPFIAEIVCGGDYVPLDRSTAAQLDDFSRQIQWAESTSPLFATALFGSDSWSVSQAVEAYGRAIQRARASGLAVSFETHRSRPTFHPWVTAELLRQLPELELTCDFSHWCCVTERLILDEQPDLLALCASRARHIHGRIGYAQGPQVPHPAAPEYRRELLAHERWWDAIWSTRIEADALALTITPEFGPDGYLHVEPFFSRPVADLDEINRWMAVRQRDRFALRQPSVVNGGVR